MRGGMGIKNNRECALPRIPSSEHPALRLRADGLHPHDPEQER